MCCSSQCVSQCVCSSFWLNWWWLRICQIFERQEPKRVLRGCFKVFLSPAKALEPHIRRRKEDRKK